MDYIGISKATFNTFQNLEDDFRKVHGNRYAYDNVLFFNARTPVNITCYIHGDFEQQPRAHKQGAGCPKCFHETNGISRRKPYNMVRKEVIDKISNRFSLYSFIEDTYTGAKSRLSLKCSECGRISEHRVNSVLTNKFGCRCNMPSIWSVDTYKNRPATLYYVKIGEFYKIGITLSTVSKRFSTENLPVRVVKEWKFDKGVFNMERLLLNEYKSKRYTGSTILKNGGDAELFSCDILELDVQNIGGVPSIS